METKKEFKTGNIELPDSILEPKNAKVRISILFDGDLLEQIRDRAARDGEKYQPWITKKLRELVGGRLATPEQLDQMIARINAIESKLSELEMVKKKVRHIKSARKAARNAEPQTRKLRAK